MSSKEPTLDEIQWRDPNWLALNAVHSNSVLFYFAESPFFDKTSNNAVLFSQAMYNPNMIPIIQTREAFTARLKTMSGLEFIVAQEPAETGPGAGTGVWVIRKQTRRKRQGEEDEITPHASYFVVGDSIYQAPTFGDILSSRMLSVISSVNKFLSTASTLPDFSPSLGHTYLPPTSSSRAKPSSTLLSQTSKESTPLPDSLSSKKPLSSSTNTNTYLSSRLLEESLNISLKYGDEYMDQTPITGQPGDFHLSTGKKDKLVVPATANKGPLSVGKPAAPTPLKTDIPPTRKGSKSEKSPKTPGGGAPKPKRRKSKALGAGGISPT